VEHYREQRAIRFADHCEWDAYAAAVRENEVLKMKLSHFLAFIGLVFLTFPLLGQDQPAPFVLKVDTQLVVQTVTVTGKDGKPIEGLKAADFLLTEDNIPQVISVFEFEKLDDTVLPLPQQRVITPNAVAEGPAPLQSRIAPAPPGDSLYQDRRLLALYFDMEGMRDDERFRALASARKFIATQMTASDMVSIFTYSDSNVRVRQDFTDDRTALEEVITGLENGDEIDFSFQFGQDSGEFNLFNTDRQLAALQTAVQMLGVLKGKKSLIDFTGGINLQGVDNQAQLRATLNAARRANVAFYPVDARGLVASAPMGNASQRSPGGLGMYTGATAMATMRGFQRSQDALYTLAADTGGKALLDYNDLSMGIVAAQRATTSYYILGYYPTNTTKDGKLRRVKITLKNPDYKASYREAYYADKEFSKFTSSDKERQLEEALMLENPVTDLTIAMELNYFQLNSAEYFVPLAVKIPGNELVLAQKAGAERTVIDFIGEIRNEYGTIIANIRDKADFKLKGEALSVLANSPIQYDSGYTLLPGNYIIKFLARNAETGRIGTYQTDFVVPNLNKELLRLPTSSVVLGTQRIAMTDALFNAGKSKEAKAQIKNPLIEDGLKLLPSVTRVFSKGRELYVYLQAYERAAEAIKPLVVFATFFRGTERVFETNPVTVSEGMDSKSKAVPLRLTIPLDVLAPAQYTCQITVLDPTTQKVAFWQAPVKIVP
jgi:VWFA-related protein